MRVAAGRAPPQTRSPHARGGLKTMRSMNRESIAAIHNLSSEKRQQLRKLLRTKGVDLLALPVFRRPADLAVIPTSFAQQRLWFLDQFEPGSPVYNVPTTLRLSGRLDAEVLTRALNEVVRRHDVLRTTFAVVDDMPVQVVAPKLALELPQTDLSALPPAERALRADELARQEAWTRFDLAAGPLVRARLLRMSEEEHILLLTVHHIVTDAWSMGVLAREAAALYAAYALGEPSPLAPLQIQYADYAHWQRQWLGDEVLQAQVDYWARQLTDAPALSTLPTDRPRPPMQTHRGATMVLRLPARLTAGLHAVAQQAQGTLFMVLAAAFNVLLWRHTGQDDLCIGMPVASRTRAELEPLIGLFVNTLVLRTLMRRGATFSELLHQVKGTTLDAYAHQDVPFEQLVEVLRPQRNTAYSPLFQVMLTLQNAPAQADEPAGLRFESLGQENTQAKFDLTLNIAEEGEQLKTEFEYNTDLFDASTIERLAGHFSRLLEGVAADPQQRIGQLPLLDDAERHRVLVQWNDTAAEYPHGSTIHDLFEQQATRTPDAIAVVFEGASLTYAFEGASLTYRELNARANRIAHHLITLGVSAGDCVALALPRSDDLVAAELAVLKCGAAYVPLDLEHPTERLHFMLADCAARVLVCRSHCSLLGLTRLEVDRLAEPGVYTDPQRPVHPQAGAYVMYTSGSTGTPKGVMVAHQAVVKLVVNNGYARFDASDRVAFAANPAFDASTLEVWAPLLHGGTLVVISQDILLDAPRFALALQRHAVSVLWLTVGLFNQYAQALSGVYAQLRYLIVGGDALDPQVIAQVLRDNPPQHLLNGYGPTETTTFAITHEVHEVPPGARGIPLGRPISNTRIYLLDAHGAPVPMGVPGEIHIGGLGLARGYLKRADLTAERFIPDPFGEPGSRMYKTGDVGRWLADGTIEFLGRNDHQVKIRGFRIEPGEIEAALRSHPEVREAVVLAREDGPGGKRLVAYVVGEAAPEALRTHLGSCLPEYMIPAAYVLLDTLPLTPNGKLDRKALPAPDGSAYGAPAHEAPQGEIETTLAPIWSELLSIERIGRHDHFFALGGHSLLAVQLTSRIRATLGLEVPLAELFAQPTLAGYAKRVAAATGSVLPAIVPAPRHEALPLSFAQQRLWFLAQLDDRADAAYSIPVGVRLKGSLNGAALQAAMNRVVARHEALRTCFGSVDGTPVQVVAAPEMGLALSHADLSNHADAEAELERLAAEEALAPFDLAHGPLIRARLIRLADDDHALLVTMHHIVSDGWSMSVLVNEFSALYAAFSQGRPDPLPPLPIQYADYAVWQRRWITGEVLQRQLDFWRNHLGGAPALLELPTDRPRPAVQDYTGASFGFELDAELTAHLKALSQRHGSTLFMTLLAAWAALLSRLSGQSDVVIGTPVANRHHAEIEPLIGFFVNTQALRVDLSGSPSLAELLGQVRATALAAQEHQDIPFEQVVEALSPTRSMAHSPIFQVWFAWQNAPEGSLDLPGLQLEPVGASSTTARFDLELILHDAGERIAGSLGYACGLFDRSSVERHLAHWQTLLRGLVADDSACVARLPLLTEPEQQHLLSAFNNTATPFPHERCIHQLFEEQVDRTPEATALVFEDTLLTYSELNALANRIAHQLIAVGVRKDSRVAIALPRGIDMVVALLATLKAGGAYVPLDPDYPAERLAYMLDDCRPRVVLTHTAVQERLPASRALLTATVLELDDSGNWAHQPTHNPEPAELGLMPSHLAYVIYTSGSTGLPKGVMVAHRNAVHIWAALERGIYAYHGGIERVSLNASLSFDASVQQWVQLASGRTLVIVPDSARRDATALLNLIATERIDAFDCTPSQLQLIHSAWASAAWRAPTLALVGGEAIDPALWGTLAGSTDTRYYNVYGPTECTVDSTIAFIQTTAVAPHIGRPVANARIYILDKFGAPVAVGMAGELYISGGGVTRGYLGRPDLTAERFVPDPFGEPGSRMYKTGDLGRWRPDGTIEFLGRNDHQVKIRGFRIELGEIEAALRSHPEVRDAVVLAREDAPGDKRLVAYVVGEAAPEVLRQHLGSRLPEYMVPAAYVTLDVLPLTPNGKLDRRALPSPEEDALGARTYESPQGEMETLLARLWSELLGLERIGRHEDFFILGGHSLLAVQLTSRIRATLGLEVPLAELFAQPTLAGFAQRVEAASASALPAIVPASRHEALPLSFAQHRLWFLAQLDERASAAYAIPGGVRLKGSLDVAALHAALNRIVERHEALRTCFTSVDGAPVQVVAAPEMGFALSQADLSGHAEAEAKLERLAAEEASAPFDLNHGPLIRGRLIRLADDDHALLVTMHHIVSDGWSMGVLINEFSALYAAFSQGQPDPLLPLTIQYADYAVWQRRWITGEVLQRQLDFWRDHLSGAPALLELPTDRPRPRVQDYAGASFGFELDAELTKNLKALSQRHGTTLFMTLLAAWAALLARLSGQSDVVIGTPVANRHRAEIEPLIGFFVNTQALRIDLSSSTSVAQLLAQVRATALAAQEHQDVPFEQVVETLSPQRSLAHSPVFQVMFAWQNAPQGSLEMPGLQLQPVGAEASTIRFDLDLSLHDAGDCIAAHIGYACALFDRATVERHIAHWQTLLRALVADDQAIVTRLPLLSDDEKHQLLRGFNGTSASFPAERCIHQLFEEQAARTPDATALVFEETSLSYAELNSQANRLAHYLIALGIAPDTRVAIALPRGIQMVVALLATLKAGGAYVPLDPNYPAERLAFMVADSSPRVLLTESGVLGALGDLAPSLAVLQLDVDHSWPSLPAANLDAASLGLTPQHLAYVIYTSGSTGRPKGTMVAHAGLCNLALAQIDGFGVTPTSRVLQFASFSFDACISEVLVTLCSGAALHVPAPGVLAGSTLHDVLREGHITHATLPPAVLGALPVDGLPDLQTLVMAGEAASHALVQRWATGRRLINAYGPTEATVCASMHLCDTHHPGSPPIGSPIANTRVYILDAHGEPSPVGVVGEIHIAGIQVARGYLRRPDLTAERFVPDPFGKPGLRMYKTGDLGRWRADGTIEFLGRSDHQVKIRGFRVELGEIEAALRLHPEVHEAVVLAREDASGDKGLVAYVVGEVAPEVLRVHLGSRLPEYMVPAAYVALDALPLTPNGKLDRRALPMPSDTAFSQQAYEAPEGELELTLAAIWRELLGVERVGRNDNFFSLGGHSLLGIQVLSRVSRQLNITLPLRVLFEARTVRELAECINAEMADMEEIVL